MGKQRKHAHKRNILIERDENQRRGQGAQKEQAGSQHVARHFEGVGILNGGRGDQAGHANAQQHICSKIIKSDGKNEGG